MSNQIMMITFHKLSKVLLSKVALLYERFDELQLLIQLTTSNKNLVPLVQMNRIIDPPYNNQPFYPNKLPRQSHHLIVLLSDKDFDRATLLPRQYP